MGEALPIQMVTEIDTHTATAFPSIKDLPERAASYTEIYATVLVQARLRGYIQRKRMQSKLGQAKKSATNKVKAVTAMRKSGFARRVSQGGDLGDLNEAAGDHPQDGQEEN